MRIESSVTSISWIPSEAIEGLPRLPFEVGIGHYDEPPPDRLAPGDLERLRDANRFRKANQLKAWIEVQNGRVVDYRHEGGGLVGSTLFTMGPEDVVVPGVAFDVLRPDPQPSDDAVRFVQTVGGRAGFPAPRRVRGKPYFQIHSATAWTTLALTVRSDGLSEHELVGASAFPRHWIYDDQGRLVQKSGTVDFRTWYKEAHGEHTPWGHEDSEAFVTAAETALERQLSREVMTGEAAPRRRRVAVGETLLDQGEPGEDLFLVLDGLLMLEVDGQEFAELGPGAIVGERAVLEGGRRTSTLRARTPCRVAVFPADQIDRGALEELAVGHRSEG
ncbi:MAG: cyclic nucleotide-binding domain-containing protein [Trebonia sp.]